MHNVRAKGNVNCAGDVRSPCGTHETDTRMRTADIVNVLTECRSETDAAFASHLGSDCERVRRLTGHPELAAGELRRHVFARLAGKRQFKIMNCGRAVHRHSLNDAALNPIGEVRRTSHFDDVSANRGDDRAPFCFAANNVIAQLSQFDSGELAGQGVDPIADCGVNGGL